MKMILDEVKETYIKDLLKQGKRGDERGLMDYREIKLTKGYIPNAEGSALCQIGDTKVLVGVKIDLSTPYPDRPTEGSFSVNAEFCPMSHPDFRPGPPNEQSIELARVVDRGIRSAECIDLNGLFLEEGKALGVFTDVYVLDHCGNLIDTAALAAMAALTNCRMPKYEDGKLVRTEFNGNLKLARKVAACSFEKIGDKFIVDANSAEETASDGRLTLSTCDGDLVCAAQKSGKVGVSKAELMQLVDAAFEKGKWLRAKL
ncbi:RNA-binding protein [Candidatus Micrarchaeota archaeon CG_4_10_14_0_2_um_filter_60_11]|nr:MAG: hypothetical protein AUJ16_00350 [Candidatus Micrarchaeota archaeon CG1_02_60_51]PIN96666.1 MAG: RNA-binding protein [Candidatus Micrarchaeota archaeon CG10_big_fil_rev_8_21_14_0_10_60_32]PIO02405.1 MAG: RNA-binding protein [Candidatus Micrarchaeota archaeon CG09_land_8_20_14_0_10_60_16]PIY91468.1 MAG: RNA-binding protein [Candidatus Micrarchaeota archaeon CG_4_10_14_0_8_um_filter_60_7]PIZ91275.1 MAG: RNA-binding protein [Candidatus Micrarchaeota archaeon CG_4_10_14_0_2_um_filter_60_11]